MIAGKKVRSAPATFGAFGLPAQSNGFSTLLLELRRKALEFMPSIRPFKEDELEIARDSPSSPLGSL